MQHDGRSKFPKGWQIEICPHQLGQLSQGKPYTATPHELGHAQEFNVPAQVVRFAEPIQAISEFSCWICWFFLPFDVQKRVHLATLLFGPCGCSGVAFWFTKPWPPWPVMTPKWWLMEALDLIDKMLRYDPAARILPKEAWIWHPKILTKDWSNNIDISNRFITAVSASLRSLYCIHIYINIYI